MSFGGGGQADYRINYIISTKSEGTGAGPINQVSAATDKMTASNQKAVASADQLKTAHERVTQAGLGVSKAAKGMAFGFIGMTTAGAEMVGMLSMYQATQDGVKEAQEAVNEALKEGGEGSAEYKSAMQDLAKANRWAQMTFRNLMLSIFDMIPFLVLSVNGILKLRQAMAAAREARAMEASLKALGTASAATSVQVGKLSTAQKVLAGSNLSTNGSLITTIPNLTKQRAAMEKAVVSTTKLSKAMRVLSLAMKIAIPLALIEIGSQAYVRNFGGFADKLNAIGVAAGNAIPQLRGVFDIIGKVGRSIAAIFTGDFEGIGEIWASQDNAKKIKAMSKAEEKALKEYESMLEDAINAREDFFAEMSKMDNEEQNKLIKSIGFKGDRGDDLEKVLDRFEKVREKIQEIGDSFKTIDQLKVLDAMGLKGADIELEKVFFTLEDKFDQISEKFGKGTWGKEIFNKAEEVMRQAAKNPEDAAEIIAEFVHNNPAIIDALEKLGMHDVANFLFVQAEEEMKRQQAQYVAKHKAAFDKMAADEASGANDRAWAESGLGEASDLEPDKTPVDPIIDQFTKGFEKLKTTISSADWTGLGQQVRTGVATIINPANATAIGAAFKTYIINPMLLMAGGFGEMLKAVFATSLQQFRDDPMGAIFGTANMIGAAVGGFVAGLLGYESEAVMYATWAGKLNQYAMKFREFVRTYFSQQEQTKNEPGSGGMDMGQGTLFENWISGFQVEFAKFYASIQSNTYVKSFREWIVNPIGALVNFIKNVMGQETVNKVVEEFTPVTIESFLKDTGIQGWLDTLPTGDDIFNKVKTLPGVKEALDFAAAVKGGVSSFLDWVMKQGGNIAFGDTGGQVTNGAGTTFTPFELNDADFDKEFAKITIPPIKVPEVDVVPGHLNITPSTERGGNEGSGHPGTWGSAYAVYIGATPTVMIPEVNATTENLVFTDLAIQAKVAFDAIKKTFDEDVVAKIADGAAALASHWSSIMNSFINNAESAADGITSAIDEAMSNAEERMSDLADHWSSMCNSLINNAESAADGINDALDSIEDEEVKIVYKISTQGSPPSGRAHGESGMWVHKPTMLMVGEQGPELVQVTRAHSKPGVGDREDREGSGGSSGVTIFNGTVNLKIDGNEIINDTRLTRKVKMTVGEDRDKFG